MKKFLTVLLSFWLATNVMAVQVTQLDTAHDINSFDISGLLDFPAAQPIFGLIGANGNPLTDTIIPLNFDLSTGKPLPVSSLPITVTPNAAELGGGFILQSGVGFGIIPTKFFEPVFFDGGDWHTADKIAETGNESLSFLFDPHPTFGPDPQIIGPQTESMFIQLGGNQGGLLMADVSAVPIPGAALLFGSGLIGFTMVARRKTKNGHGFAA